MLQTIILGIIQGLTEFLPVSSSGHLAVFSKIFGLESNNLFLETAMHFGTLLSLLIFFRIKIYNTVKHAFNEVKERSVEKDNLKFIGYVIIGILPAAIVGLLLYDFINKAFDNMIFVGIMFLVTGGILFATKFLEKKANKINIKNSLFVGIMQIFALLPGISRSGITISSGVCSGMSREKAADFSFFMAMPLILAGFIKEFIDTGMNLSLEIIMGIIASFISGYMAVYVLYKILKSRKFYMFSYYLLPLGIAVIIFGILK